MADTKEMRAKQVYETLCAALDARGWRYKKFEEDLVITFTVSGDDIPMEFVLIIDANRQLIRLSSKLPFTVSEDKRMELAIATCAVTDRLVDGSFDYDITKGTIYFRMTASFRDSQIGEGLFRYMVDCSASTVDDFNDKFLALSKGLISINDFLAK